MNRRRLLIALLVGAVCASTAVFAKKTRPVEPSYAWEAGSPFGLQRKTTIDTMLYNYYQRSVPSEVSIAYATTGNLGSEGLNMIWSERRPASDFFFQDALRAWMPTIGSQKFYNTRIPMTILSYNTGGGRDNEQNRLKGIFSGNINRRFQVGAMIDYLYSKGSYNYQATNDLNWGFSTSYIGDRFTIQAFYNHWNLLNKENGGITNDLYITDPAALQGGDDKIDPKSIPTRLTAAHSRLIGNELWTNLQYKVGFWREEAVNDTLTKKTFVPVTSFFWTFDYRNSKHLFLNTSSTEDQNFWENTYISAGGTRDSTSFWTVNNYLGFRFHEGFHKRIPFALGAFVHHEVRRYIQTVDTVSHDPATRPEGLTPWPEGVNLLPAFTQNMLSVGGVINRSAGSLLNFNASGEVHLAGAAAGKVVIDGDIATRFRLGRDTVAVTAFASFSNGPVPSLIKRYVSNHFVWSNDFGFTRRVKIGGRFNVPLTATRLEVMLENLQNYFYFGPDCLPRQHGANVQVISASLDQRLRLGILHWDNKIVFQTSSDQAVIPLPKLALYSNLYLWFKVAKVLQVQFGVDCDYYTRYYAPGYQPATMSFYNQREQLIGNYPFCNLYVNMQLKRARFYLMMTHINQGWFGKNYFSIPGYPLNPRRFQLGVAVDFLN